MRTNILFNIILWMWKKLDITEIIEKCQQKFLDGGQSNKNNTLIL